MISKLRAFSDLAFKENKLSLKTFKLLFRQKISLGFIFYEEYERFKVVPSFEAVYRKS